MWSTVSKAADMSIMMNTVKFLLSKPYKISSVISIRAVSVEKPVLYADWNLSCKLLISKCSFYCPVATFSKILDKNGK